MLKQGRLAEEHVARYLIKQGYEIIAKNVIYACGELDLVALDGETLVFVEVKYRKNNDFSAPYEAVNKSKQKKIIRAAQAYLQKYVSEPLCRFDVVSLCGTIDAPLLEHIEDAFVVEEGC